jgi:DNA-binding CsgD family transcriptional regulator
VDKKSIVESLTPREFQVLREYAILGNANDVAKRLGISPKTVHHYLSIVKSRFDCKDAFKTVVLAFDYLNISTKDLQAIPPVYVTPTQRKVLSLIVVGMRSTQIANCCGIERKSVNIYVNKILSMSHGKLKNRIQLFTYNKVLPDLFVLKPPKPTIKDMIFELGCQGKTTQEIVAELNCNAMYVASILRSLQRATQESGE